jgi:hypothetical protein
MSDYLLTAKDLRGLLLDSIPSETSAEMGDAPDLNQFFVPKSHARALKINVPIVIGDRGAGKSFWWSRLQSREHRERLEKVAPDTRIRANTYVIPGYGIERTIQGTPSINLYPSENVWRDDLLDKFPARSIWKAIVLWSVDLELTVLPPGQTWPERVRWLMANTEAADRLIQAKEVELIANYRDILIVFDALDSITNDPTQLDDLVEGLAQVALELRSFRKLHAKVFLRSDQFGEQRVGRFADASKLRASSIPLSWLTNELYGLLWHLMSNHPGGGGNNFRLDMYRCLNLAKVQKQKIGKVRQEELLKLDNPEDWQLPAEALFDLESQELLFHHLTGPYMGENARKGFPYRWLPTHLADAHGLISPRSFLMALRRAAEDTRDMNSSCEYAVDYRYLHAGVRSASAVRVDEIAEHPWVLPLMNPLRGALLIPFEFEQVQQIWMANRTLDNEIVTMAKLVTPDLARQALVQLGIFRPMRTGRIDVPDIYRLGFGLRRKGGVSLAKSGERR